VLAETSWRVGFVHSKEGLEKRLSF
jgi:hypothetical protein